MITDRDYAIALWRLKKHNVPDRMDWLHEAVVDYYEQQPDIDEGRLGNWLGLVAWRKWQDYEKRWTSRRVFSSEQIYRAVQPEQTPATDDLEELMQGLTPKRKEALILWARGLNMVQAARSVGVCPQAMHNRRQHLIKCIRDRK